MHSSSKESDAERGMFVSNGQDEKAKKTRKPRGFTIPLSLLLLVGSMAIAAAICVPVAVLAFVGASQTVDTVVTIVRQNYAQIVRNWILNLGAQTESVAAIGASGPALLRALDTLVDGVHHDFAQDADIAWEFYNLWKSSPSFLTIGYQRTVTQDSFYIGTECISCYALEINQPYCDTFDILAVDYKNANITLNHTSTQDVGIEPLDPTFPATLQFQGPEWFLDTSSPGDPVLQNLLFFYINQCLTKVMKQATNMDFSALSGKTLDDRVPIRELSDMQQVFHEILAKFAAAITANKRLHMPPGARQSFNIPIDSNGSHVSRSPGAVAMRETIAGEAL
ncbi:hypothetical protein HKX48_006945 [Thoreauomyces humboldtii]|nr:hypothetical protein HKX48_006945 [Thoreauomyces humboldtii]